jgi:mRNA interferase RelE/StbE
MNHQNAETWRVDLASRVTHSLSRISAEERGRVLLALDKLSRGPYVADSRKLKGRPEWRLRIGERRALFLADFETLSIVVTALGSRGDVYKDD